MTNVRLLNEIKFK